jgi:hypothetical protein
MYAATYIYGVGISGAYDPWRTICVPGIAGYAPGLTPKGRRPFFGPFLDFGQAIVDAIFVQKFKIFCKKTFEIM